MCSVIERSIQGNLNIKPNQMRLFKENDCLEYGGRGNALQKKELKQFLKVIIKNISKNA